MARALSGGSFVVALLLAACSSSSSPSPPARPAASVTPVRPDALVGTWLFEMKRGGTGDSIQSSLHFSMSNGILAGSLTGPDGNVRELSNILVTENKKVGWDIETGAGKLHCDGTIDGSSMRGTAKRSASQRRSRGDSEGESGDSSPPSPGGYGGYGRGGGRGGRGGRGGGARSGEGMTWSAYKSVAAPAETSAPAATPTPSSSSSR